MLFFAVWSQALTHTCTHTNTHKHTRTAPGRHDGAGDVESGGASASLETGGSGADTGVDSLSGHTGVGDASGRDQEEDESSFSDYVDAHAVGDAHHVDAAAHRDGWVQEDAAASRHPTTSSDTSLHSVMNIEGAGLDKTGASQDKSGASLASQNAIHRLLDAIHPAAGNEAGAGANLTLENTTEDSFQQHPPNTLPPTHLTTANDDSMAAQAGGNDDASKAVNAEQLGDAADVMAATHKHPIGAAAALGASSSSVVDALCTRV